MTGVMLLGFVGFAFATSVTPGPNNAMLLASGVNFGLIRTVPHMLGISTGCVLMLVLVGLGLGQVFAAVPALYEVLRYGGALYLLWLAWHIAAAGAVRPDSGRGRPMRFVEALLFQWINPKAWVMVVGAVSTYAPREHFLGNVVVLAAGLVVVGLPSIALWAGFGLGLRRFLGDRRRMRAFNVTMAGLLVASLYPLLEG